MQQHISTEKTGANAAGTAEALPRGAVTRPPVGRDTAEAKAWGKLSSQFSNCWPMRNGFPHLSRDADSYTGVVQKYKESKRLLWVGIIIGIAAFALMAYNLYAAPADMPVVDAIIPSVFIALVSFLIITAASCGVIKFGCEDGLAEMVESWNKAKGIIIGTETWKYLVDEIHQHYYDKDRCAELNAECAETWRAEMSGICVQIHFCEAKRDMKGKRQLRGSLNSMLQVGRDLGFVTNNEDFKTFFQMAAGTR